MQLLFPYFLLRDGSLLLFKILIFCCSSTLHNAAVLLKLTLKDSKIVCWRVVVSHLERYNITRETSHARACRIINSGRRYINNSVHVQAAVSLLFITILDKILEDDWTSKDERKHHGAVDKSSSNNRSVLRTASAFVMLKIGPVRLALVGLTAGWRNTAEFGNFQNHIPDEILHFLQS